MKELTKYHLVTVKGFDLLFDTFTEKLASTVINCHENLFRLKFQGNGKRKLQIYMTSITVTTEKLAEISDILC